MTFVMPNLNPANVAEYLEFGLYGIALSRFSGMWVGFKAMDYFHSDGYASLLSGTEVRVNPWVRADKLYPRVVRGGSWREFPEGLRSAARSASYFLASSIFRSRLRSYDASTHSFTSGRISLVRTRGVTFQYGL